MNQDYEVSSEKLLIRTAIPILSLLKMEIDQTLNEHARLYLAAIALPEKQEEILYTDQRKKVISVFLKEDGVLFSGFVEKLICKKENQFLQIEIKAVSPTERLDRHKKRQSFQDTGMTYKQVIHKVLAGQGQVQFRWNLKEDRAIGSPIIQYDETDWEFLKRLCSHFHEPLLSDCRAGHPAFAFGMDHGKEQNGDDHVVCGAGIDNKSFCLRAETKENWQMGDYISYEGGKYHVYQKKVMFRKGELTFIYRLGMEQVYHQRKIYNKMLAGTRLEGTVRRTNEETVYLQLDIDQEERADYPWFWTPETNTLCYCMPETGTKAVLYLPSQEEAEGRVVLAVVRNPQNGNYSDTQKREFVTGYHKKLGLYPLKIFVENMDGSVTCSMDDKSGITIGSNTGITFLADGEICCTGNNITIMTPVKAVGRTAQSNIELCRDINLYAPEGVITTGTGEEVGKHVKASAGKLLKEPAMEHWQTSFSAIAAVPQMDLGQIGEAEDVIDILANGSVAGIAGGSAVVAMSEVMAGKKESETSFPNVFKSMDNYIVKGGYKLPEE